MWRFCCIFLQVLTYCICLLKPPQSQPFIPLRPAIVKEACCAVFYQPSSPDRLDTVWSFTSWGVFSGDSYQFPAPGSTWRKSGFLCKTKRERQMNWLFSGTKNITNPGFLRPEERWGGGQITAASSDWAHLFVLLPFNNVSSSLLLLFSSLCFGSPQPTICLHHQSS